MGPGWTRALLQCWPLPGELASIRVARLPLVEPFLGSLLSPTSAGRLGSLPSVAGPSFPAEPTSPFSHQCHWAVLARGYIGARSDHVAGTRAGSGRHHPGPGPATWPRPRSQKLACLEIMAHGRIYLDMTHNGLRFAVSRQPCCGQKDKNSSSIFISFPGTLHEGKVRGGASSQSYSHSAGGDHLVSSDSLIAEPG